LALILNHAISVLMMIFPYPFPAVKTWAFPKLVMEEGRGTGRLETGHQEAMGVDLLPAVDGEIPAKWGPPAT
jgi:hypothetical protein